MEVEELKQVIDANAVEMREGFARIDERFARIDERFARIDERFARVDERFGRMEERIKQEGQDTRRHFEVVLEHFMGNVVLMMEDLESRLTRKFTKH